jgi:rare lipoprotein A
MKLIRLAALAAAVFVLSHPFANPSQAGQQPVVQTASGNASWYGAKFHGRRTANGERYDMNQMTAAHRSLPFGTKVRVINQRNGRSVVVRINDRGPFSGRRIIDLSRGAAGAIGMVNSGVAPVKLEVLN